MPGTVHLDGSHGEGGGQILRTALSLSAITRRPIRIDNIRAGRPNPGLAAQHLTTVRAVGTVCEAQISGDSLGSTTIHFVPRTSPRSGRYAFDVASARQGGSAGSAALVLQSLLLPLAFCRAESCVTVRGGTHIPWSPTFDYLQNVWIPALASMGVTIAAKLGKWGWFPAGGGEIEASVRGRGDIASGKLKPLRCCRRGALEIISGRAVAANLPAPIAQRMTDRARAILRPLGAQLAIAPERVRADCAGAGIFLTAEYESNRCGFTALGKRGKPAEAVAEEAAEELFLHHRSNAAVDPHLADQMILPLSLASDESAYSTGRITRHLSTNAWVVEQFGDARIMFEEQRDGTSVVRVSPCP